MRVRSTHHPLGDGRAPCPLLPPSVCSSSAVLCALLPRCVLLLFLTPVTDVCPVFLSAFPPSRTKPPCAHRSMYVPNREKTSSKKYRKGGKTPRLVSDKEVECLKGGRTKASALQGV